MIISGCISLGIAILAAIYVSFTARERGPILSNSYMILSKKEREKADKKAEYHLVTVIFSLVSIMFLMISISLFTNWLWPRIIMWVCVVAEVGYALYDGVKSYKK